ncbi:hypothetical protein PtrSN002B_003929 [Pyrenophora tritici-repentis]|uniref:Uncharacterized protein n=1 Tax=Pyrenophora tritici-repentis TaxID=45151 RepID=A0A2W1CUI4_9PLEO|nr:hypothetical protein PtrV1_06389 [Pyrenophora tritici-repentis]KAF7451109.1 hypothetical protein A1F99_057250 [Pyrenophora tritici-repentis]KAF7573793.1 hypothetical protein PtrM4_086980 [Pyrenophora tritici-repentis]KAG9380681.1 hypothetical protein A1F94_008001 [Pyrenophora tritici-repentis]KAI0572645.1 hypothetical protein Alg215_09651 [Pyrenophora tritici-repentis]
MEAPDPGEFTFTVMEKAFHVWLGHNTFEFLRNETEAQGSTWVHLVLGKTVETVLGVAAEMGPGSDSTVETMVLVNQELERRIEQQDLQLYNVWQSVWKAFS